MRIAYAEYRYNVPVPILLFHKIALLLVVQYGNGTSHNLVKKQLTRIGLVDQVGVVSGLL